MNPTIQYRPLGRRLNVWEQNTWTFTFAIVLTRILRSKKPPAPWMTLFISKILYWGTSEWSGEQLQAVHALCQEHGYYPPQVEQPQYNLLVRRRFEEDVLPAARELGHGPGHMESACVRGLDRKIRPGLSRRQSSGSAGTKMA